MKTKFRESSTFVMVVGLVIAEHALLLSGVFDKPGLSEYGVCNAGIMSIWLGREWRAAHYSKE